MEWKQFIFIGLIFVSVLTSLGFPWRLNEAQAVETNIYYSSPETTLHTTCAHLLGSCDYYLCRESLQSCGPRGYWINFGNRYCKKFITQVKPTLSVESQSWLENVGRCLREKIEAFPTDADCKQVGNRAIASHAGCYLKTGFCQVPFWEKVKVLQTVYRELTDTRILQEFFEISSSCGLNQLGADNESNGKTSNY